MSGNLKDAVRRRIDDGLTGLEVFGTEAIDDFRPRGDFITDVAVTRLFRKGIEEIFRKGLFKGRERIFDGVPHKFPVAAGRILTHGNFLHEAVRADDVRIFMMDVGDLPETHAAQIRQAQRDVSVDVTVRIGPLIAEAFGIGGSAGATLSVTMTMMRLNFMCSPFL